MSDRATPALSVVVASWCDEARLTQCLASLEHQCAQADVIVATALDESTMARVQARFPFVRAHHAAGATVFRLRALGAACAVGNLVALIEDHVTVAPDWADALVAAHRAGHGVIGGPVDNGQTTTAFDWALYFVEYGVHMPPVAEGRVSAVSGVNVAYDRALLDTCQLVWRDTLQENEVNDALASRGVLPHMAPAALVSTHLPMTLSAAMAHLFEGGRHFGRYRAGHAPAWKRALWIVVSPAVPFVLFARIVRRVQSRAPSRMRVLARGIVHVALLLGAWSVGELTGYVSGAPPRARAQ